MKSLSLQMLVAPTEHPFVSPHAKAAEASIARRCRTLGIWQDHLDEYNTMSAYLFPYADEEQLRVIGLYNNLLYFVDDQFDRHKAEQNQQPEQLETLFAQAASILFNGELPTTDNPVLTTVYELHHGLVQLAPTEAWFTRFVKNTIEHLQSSLRDIEVDKNDKIGSWFDHYNELRDLDSGMAPTVNLIELALGREIPEHIRQMPLVQKARHYVARYCSLSNDLFSYDKEVVAHQSDFNAVVMLEYDGYSLEEAIDYLLIELNKMVTDFLELYEDAQTNHSLSESEQRDLCDYMNALWHQIAAAYHWQFSTNRYRSSDSIFIELQTRLDQTA